MLEHSIGKESELRDLIYDWLVKSGVFCWKDRQGVSAPGRGTFRSSRGVSDLLGIVMGRMLAVEVKKPKGILSSDQQKFLFEVERHGGIAIVARSLEDVVGRLKKELKG